MNSREAKLYSNHTTLSQDDHKYWIWSFDEIGRYDLAACVDHVLEATGAPKLTIMALSQGLTITLVLLSTRPEYNEKIDLVIGYGPVANITHSGPPISLAMPILPSVLLALDPFSRGAYLGASDGLQRLVSILCEAIKGHLCSSAMTITHLGSPPQVNRIYKAKNFLMYDHGMLENQRRYGQVAPPAYPLEHIRTPFALFSSQGDLVADTRDVADLVKALGSNVISHIVCELIKYHGYPCELTYATTDDGYVLEVDHIPHDRGGSPSASYNGGTPRYPVLLVPVFCGASDVWFLNSPSQSLGKFCSNVFRYFDEIGRYDVAASVDHVLNATGAPKLTIMALSQGVIETLVLLSARPEYNNKVDLVIAYGPVANVTHVRGPLSIVPRLIRPVLFAMDPLYRGAYVGTSTGLQRFLSTICKVATGRLCSALVALTLLSSPLQLNKTRVPMYAGHYPKGTTVQNLRHLYQVYKAKDFVMYDHGAKENRLRYGQVAPPAYPLERISTRFAIFSSEGDVLADKRDVADLMTRLGSNVVFHRVVPEKTFGHVDFAIGYNAKEFLHDVAMDLIPQYATQRH
ncbi:hypothetical protein HPB50_001061 [Hyalomma asiaticum]|uniref:Uncharacterized protein n=1 Tax=Hyalomma asiaticum TaxID=266040 RepID=A0ACB7RRA2_HYAAI|nr:hypothetical protein HPB50_001061 [Hyalomma asiaticum]